MKSQSLLSLGLIFTLLVGCGGSGSGSNLFEGDPGSGPSATPPGSASNTAPSPADDDFQVFANSSDNRLAVLMNDADADGDQLSIESVPATSDQGGALRVEDFGNSDPSDDVIEYDPPVGFVGSDSFEYVVNDGQESAVAGVTITVV